MQRKYFVTVLCLSALWVGACGDRQAEEPVVATTATVEAPLQIASIPKYSAEAFFETTTYALVGSSAHTFSPDGSSLLMSSDATGVFIAYALPVDGSAAEQLTDSDGIACDAGA